MLLDEADFVHRASIVPGDLSAIVANSNVKAWFPYNRPDRRDWIGAIQAIRMVVHLKNASFIRIGICTCFEEEKKSTSILYDRNINKIWNPFRY